MENDNSAESFDFVETDDLPEEDANDADLVIVGAGLTGLTLAHDVLRRQTGLTVLLIDGNDDVGGRIPVGEFSEIFYAHATQKNVTRLIDKLGIDTYTGQPIGFRKRVWFTETGPLTTLPTFYAAQVCHFLQTVQESSLHPRFRGFETYFAKDENLAENSVDDFLKRLVFSSLSRSLCSSLICNSCGTKNLENVSVLWFFVVLHGAGGFVKRLKTTLADDHRYFVRGGMTRIVEKLKSEIILLHGTIKCREPVRKIQFNDDRAYVWTTENCFKCSSVVIALPPPEVGRIVIEPSLPDRYRNSQEMYENSGKSLFLLNYRRPFWLDEYSGDVLATPFSPTNLNLVYDATRRTDEDENFPRLAGFFDKGDRSILSDRLDILRQCFRNDEALDCVDYREENYDFYGCVSSVMCSLKPCALEYHVNCMDKPFRRIFFAASEYASGWPGTADGAIEAGKVTSCRVLARLRPQCLTYTDIVQHFGIKRRNAEYQPAKSPLFGLMNNLCLAINVSIFLTYARQAYNIGK